MLRAIVGGTFLTIALVLLIIPFVFDGVGPSSEGLLINLGTEIIGIVITVAVVEWFFERRRMHDRGRQLASETLHSIEHAVWVWQGGPRHMDTDEVRAILHSVGEDDPLPSFTESLFFSIGTRARRLLNDEIGVIGTVPGFMNSLEQLARLGSLRDGAGTVPSRKLADVVDQGAEELARALGRPTERHLAALIRHRDPNVESQERRLFGSRGEPGNVRHAVGPPPGPGPV